MTADVVALRRALGYVRWNLFGVGWSTRLMLQVAAVDARGTRSVVLDSFLPAESAWYDEGAPALTAVMAKLGVGPQFDRMVARLNARPVMYDTKDLLTDKRVTLNLTGDDVATLIGEAMRDPETPPLVPAVVEGLADGRTDLLRPVLDAATRSLRSVDWGLRQAVQCQDEVPFNTFPPGGHPRLFTGVADAAVCAAWNLPVDSAEGPITAAPVLALGGQYDAVTPPEAARNVAGALPAGRFVEFAGTGHAVFLANACARRTIAVFLDDARAAAPCDPAQPAARLVHGTGLRLTSAGQRLIDAPLLLAPPALFLITAAVQLLAGLVALARRRGGGMHALAGLVSLAFAALTAMTLYGMPDMRALVVGLPPALGWYGLLALISTVLSVGAAFRLRAGAIQIVPALVGLVFLTWLYGWLLA
jgi:pimeloyl-ACP methyl ester carboxylesterase